MGIKPFGISILMLINVALATQSTQPQVAFICNKPAVYQTDAGWVEDRSSDCLRDPQDILNFCKKVYPNKEITNVVESSELTTIDNWCGFDADRCHKHNTHTVRPFKCLVGPFQSDALLVPEHCVFDHIHGGKCGRYMNWNQTAFEACWNHSMRLDSFAMLQPCVPEVDLFNGVEYVCCPVSNRAEPTPFIVEDDRDLFADKDVTKSGRSSLWKSASKVDPNDIKYNMQRGSNDIKSKMADPVSLTNDVDDAYQSYVIKDRVDEYNEHEYFLKAKGDMQKHHHDRVSSMMKDWAAARERVAEMKVIDPKGADRLEQEITGRFQKTYEALEQEGMEEKRQISAIHQQRVTADLNNKKRSSMEKYMEVLTEANPDSGIILKALRHYIKTEEKDRLHSLNHYRHMQDDIEQGPESIHEQETIREQALDHMQIIDQRIKQAVDMLSRVPQLEGKIRQQIADYLETFEDLDEAVAKTLLSLPEADSDEESADPVADDISEQALTYEEVGDQLLDRVEKEDEPIDNNMHHVPLLRDDDVHGFGVDTFEDKMSSFDDETMEDERDLEIHELPVVAAHADHMRNDKMDVKLTEDQKLKVPMGKSSNSLYSPSATAGIAVAAIAVFVILIVGALMLRKKSSRSTRGFIAVNQNVSPEERHVANMQMNGYENPTYRYFEMNATNA